jgi:hypothetical protein
MDLRSVIGEKGLKKSKKSEAGPGPANRCGHCPEAKGQVNHGATPLLLLTEKRQLTQAENPTYKVARTY